MALVLPARSPGSLCIKAILLNRRPRNDTSGSTVRNPTAAKPPGTCDYLHPFTCVADRQRTSPLNRPTAQPARTQVACPDCGRVQTLPEASPHHVAECMRCRRVLAGPATGRIDGPLALCLAALVLLVPANGFALMHVSTLGASRAGWLSSSVDQLWQQGFPLLAIVVAAFAISLPLICIALLAWVLANVRAGRTRGIGNVFRLVSKLRPWVMLDVYLIGGFVAFSRLAAVVTVDVGMGGWCFVAATFALLLAFTQLDDRTIWDALPQDGPVTKGDLTIACTTCDLLVGGTADGGACPRCDALLRIRKPQALGRTIALVVAGYLLYLPANLVPVLTIQQVGSYERDTILSGVLELIRNDLWPLAVIVFLASIVLPLLKLGGLTWMVIATFMRTDAALVGRTRFYRMIDLIGRWSNIDVFMASILITLLRFGNLLSVHINDGMVAFAGVVVITMIATSSFDTRLMWDAARKTA
jgi:paraquat-inducible protein A